MAYTGAASLTQAACKGIIRPRNRYATVDDTLLAERIQQADKEWAKALTNALRQEAAAWQGLLRGWQLYALLVFFALGLLIVPQLPLRYQIDVGIGEGYGGDLPLLRGFNDAEFDDHGTYRWTNDSSFRSAESLLNKAPKRSSFGAKSVASLFCRFARKA